MILFIFREKGRERERQREKYHCVVASRVPPIGDLARNPGMCPDGELNHQPFGLQAHAQSTELHQPGLKVIFLIKNENVYPVVCLYHYSFNSFEDVLQGYCLPSGQFISLSPCCLVFRSLYTCFHSFTGKTSAMIGTSPLLRQHFLFYLLQQLES